MRPKKPPPIAQPTRNAAWIEELYRPTFSFRGKSGVSSSFLPEKMNRHCAKKAQERRIATNLKPFVGNPAGNQSRPVELDQRPEASLAWWVGDHPCEA
jgi:hypothetical protein